VDDEPNILSSLRRLFRARGYQVFVANGAKGWRCWNRKAWIW
jgi:DNA-binding response OmpR family regulator